MKTKTGQSHIFVRVKRKGLHQTISERGWFEQTFGLSKVKSRQKKGAIKHAKNYLKVR